jgi:hypothetical protein
MSRVQGLTSDIALNGVERKSRGACRLMRLGDRPASNEKGRWQAAPISGATILNTTTVLPDHDDDNLADEVDPADEQDAPEEEAEGGPREEEDTTVDDIPADEPLVEELQPRAGTALANNASDFSQRHIFIRYAVTDNPDRGSRLLPNPKSLIVAFPKALAQIFGGCWVAQRGEEILFDFFARSDQGDRKGYKVGNPWKWIKIKANGEIAVGISRSFTRARTDGVLERDYVVGAFRLVVPLAANDQASELTAEDQPTPMFC